MIICFSDLARIRSLHHDQDIVLAGGCYDLFHVGHCNFLKRCRALGDILIVAVSSDTRVRERKGVGRPIIPERERVTLLSAVRWVDYAMVAPDPEANHDPPTVRIIRALRPDLFATSDPRYQEYAANTAHMGTTVVHVPDVRLTSTTDIIARIRNK